MQFLYFRLHAIFTHTHLFDVRGNSVQYFCLIVNAPPRWISLRNHSEVMDRDPPDSRIIVHPLIHFRNFSTNKSPLQYRHFYTFSTDKKRIASTPRQSMVCRLVSRGFHRNPRRATKKRFLSLKRGSTNLEMRSHRLVGFYVSPVLHFDFNNNCQNYVILL